MEKIRRFHFIGIEDLENWQIMLLFSSLHLQLRISNDAYQRNTCLHGGYGSRIH